MAEAEVDTRPRNVSDDQQGASLGGVEASVDISHYIAIALLALMLAELIVRVVSPRFRARGTDSDDEGAEEPPPSDAASQPAEQDAA